MAASVTVPLMVQWQGENVYEMKEKSADDNTDDDLKEAKEKDVYALSGQILSLFNVFLNQNTFGKQYYKHDSAISENHAALLDLPPEA